MSTGVGCRFLLQGVFLAQGSSLVLMSPALEGGCLTTSTPWGAVVPQPPAAAAAKSLQSCPTLCSPIDGSPPGSSVHGIFQARVLEWVAIAFSPQPPNQVITGNLLCTQHCARLVRQRRCFALCKLFSLVGECLCS